MVNELFQQHYHIVGDSQQLQNGVIPPRYNRIGTPPPQYTSIEAMTHPLSLAHTEPRLNPAANRDAQHSHSLAATIPSHNTTPETEQNFYQEEDITSQAETSRQIPISDRPQTNPNHVASVNDIPTVDWKRPWFLEGLELPSIKDSPHLFIQAPYIFPVFRHRGDFSPVLIPAEDISGPYKDTTFLGACYRIHYIGTRSIQIPHNSFIFIGEFETDEVGYLATRFILRRKDICVFQLFMYRVRNQRAYALGHQNWPSVIFSIPTPLVITYMTPEIIDPSPVNPQPDPDSISVSSSLSPTPSTHHPEVPISNLLISLKRMLCMWNIDHDSEGHEYSHDLS